ETCRLCRRGEGEAFAASTYNAVRGASRGTTGMMAGHGGGDSAVGGPASHIPVLLAEVVSALQPAPGQVVVDGTFGAGGYTKALLAAGASVVAIDRDPDAIEAGRALEREAAG